MISGTWDNIIGIGVNKRAMFSAVVLLKAKDCVVSNRAFSNARQQCYQEKAAISTTIIMQCSG